MCICMCVCVYVWLWRLHAYSTTRLCLLSGFCAHHSAPAAPRCQRLCSFSSVLITHMEHSVPTVQPWGVGCVCVCVCVRVPVGLSGLGLGVWDPSGRRSSLNRSKQHKQIRAGRSVSGLIPGGRLYLFIWCD